MYNRKLWQDNVRDPARTYKATQNADGTTTLEPAGKLVQQGTNQSAENFNNTRLMPRRTTRRCFPARRSTPTAELFGRGKTIEHHTKKKTGAKRNFLFAPNGSGATWSSAAPFRA